MGRISARRVVRLNPGANKNSRELFLIGILVLITRCPPALAGLGGLTDYRPIVEPPHLYAFPDMTLIDDKRTLRSAMLAWRGALGEEERRAAAGDLLATLRRERPIATPAVVSGFWPIKDEIDIRPLMMELFNEGCQLALPVVQGRGLPLLFRAWRPGDPLEKGVFGTLQP